MNTLSNVRVSARSPLALGIFVAVLLMFVVIAIVRSVGSASSPTASSVSERSTESSRRSLAELTAAGLTSIKAPVSNNVADSLPAFSIQKPPDATIVSVFDNQVKGVTLIEPVAPPSGVVLRTDLSAWENTDWLAVALGPVGDKWVYGGAWFDCASIDGEALSYATLRTDEALAIWTGLSTRKKADVAKECAQ